MDAREYMKEMDRMLRTVGEPEKYSKRECYRYDCNDCPLYSDGTDMSFCGCVMSYDIAVDIVEKWVEEHPRKTIQSVFFENYPNAPRAMVDGKPCLCVNDLGYGMNCECMDSCEKCWLTPIEELEER